MTIAVDFDGTITTRNQYPDIGEIRENAIPVLKVLQNRGHNICLWTCRHGQELALALHTLEARGFTPNFVNCAPYTTGSQKIVANIYIDDASYPNCCYPEEERIDWNHIAKSFSISDEELEEVK